MEDDVSQMGLGDSRVGSFVDVELTSPNFSWSTPIAPRWSHVPRTTLPAFVSERLRTGGRLPAIEFDDGYRISCDELLDHAERLAAALARRLRVGDRVAIAIGNRAEFFIAFYAVVACRAVAVTLNPEIGVHDATHIIQDAGCVLAIADGETVEVLAQVQQSSPEMKELVRLDGPEPSGLAHVYIEERMDLASLWAPIDELIDIGYTSGTTGLPKALGGTHETALGSADDFFAVHPFGRGDKVLTPLQFHYGDPSWLFLASLAIGSPMVAMRRFSVSRFWGVARDSGATHIATIGAIPNLLLTAETTQDDQAHSIRYACAIGVPVDQHRELTERFGFPWLELYGSSEAGGIIAMPAHIADRYVGTGALGIPFPHVRVRLVADDGTELTGPGVGECEVLGGHFVGYINAPEATAEVLHDGWMRTGDLLRRDDDGIYYFVSRRKEVIRRGGENVAPSEVEGVLRLHPDVLDAAVVPVKDDLRGEEIKAYVQLHSGAVWAPENLAEFCRARLSPFKVPRYLELRTAPFPRTPSQRIPKRLLEVAGEHRTESAWDREGVGRETSERALRRSTRLQ